MSRKMGRREFLRVGAFGVVTAMQSHYGSVRVQRRRQPNLLFIHVDQIFCDAMSAHGCKYIRTPNIDRLVAQGISFRLSYSANPVCCPARSAWYT
ncbi:MAG: sulfatase-like hydrolase/transferase, partial [Candidatus Fervidibacter sacchari]